MPTLVFDEVDAGLGGATAAAVGDRLARVAERVQVLVVTHSPQVAARGAAHLRVAKASCAGPHRNHAYRPRLDSQAHRREEIARMLAGETITEAARACGRCAAGGGSMSDKASRPLTEAEAAAELEAAGPRSLATTAPITSATRRP